MRTGDSDHSVVAIRDAEHAARRRLTEVCASTALTGSDTGELVRVDALLQQASYALKRVIKLRRGRRADTTAREAALAAMADLEESASAEATHRLLRDGRGVRWDVFAVYTDARIAARWRLEPPFSRGWLCFESAGEKRRLAPIPPEWQRLGNAQLAALGDIADVVPGSGRKAG
jgi:hypothetical protein